MITDTKAAARWRYCLKHGFPSSFRQIHPTIGPVRWRMPSQEPPTNTAFVAADYPDYPSANAAVDAAMKKCPTAS